MRKYYYFIASLPELSLDDYKEPYRVGDFINQLDEVLDQRDKAVVDDLLLFYDGLNLLDLLLGKTYNVLGASGRFSSEEIKKFLEEPDGQGGQQLKFFIQQYQEMTEAQKQDRQYLEKTFIEDYYKKMLKHSNLFIRDYFHFDLQLRQVLALLNTRKHHLVETEIFEPEMDDFVVHQLSHSPLSDFGLSGELDYITHFIDVFAHQDSLQMEKLVDTLRWRKINELNTFCYFDLEVLLGFLLKLLMCERWIRLESHRGGEVLEEKIYDENQDITFN